MSRCEITFLRAAATAETADASATAYVTPVDHGPVKILRSDRGDYAATQDVADTGARSWSFGADATLELEKVHTPGLVTVREVAGFMNQSPICVLKTIVYRSNATGPALSSGVGARWIVAVVRGDHAVNERKLERAAEEAFHVGLLRPKDGKDDPELRIQWPIGFVGPDVAMRKPDAVLVVDHDAAGAGPWIAGAGEADYHFKNFNWFRECGDRLADPRKTAVADIRVAREGDPSPLAGGGTLVETRCVEIGRVTLAGPDFVRRSEAGFLRAGGITRSATLTACQLDLTRLLACIVERNHDERGIIWPIALAPCLVVIVALGYEGEVRTAADRLHEQLESAGIETLLDDRDLRAGPKFADADLIGFPIRLTVGERGLQEGAVEIRSRRSATAEMVAIEGAIAAVNAAIVKSIG